MMQMLAAGGMPLLSDGERKADTDNPKGYLDGSGSQDELRHCGKTCQPP
jgi:hypothetical protein